MWSIAGERSRAPGRRLSRGAGRLLLVVAAWIGATALAGADAGAEHAALRGQGDLDEGQEVGGASSDAAAVVRALSNQIATLERAEAMMEDGLDGRRHALRERVRAAYRRVGARPLPPWASAAERKRRLVESGLVRRFLEGQLEELDVVRRERDALSEARAALEDERAQASSRAWRAPALVWPIAGGRAIESYGMYRHRDTGAHLVRRGMTIASRPGEPVRAPMAGRVRYVGALRGLDGAVLLQHESGYWALLGQTESAVATGEEVVIGQPIGRAIGAGVYLEVRVPAGPGGLPVDPAPLLSEASP